MDKERLYGCFVKKQKNIMDFLTGAGTGLILSCLYAPDSVRRTITLFAGLVMIAAGWYKKAGYDKMIMEYLENQEGRN